jgi:hypothetical protein
MKSSSQASFTRWLVSSLAIVTGLLAAPREAVGQG